MYRDNYPLNCNDAGSPPREIEGFLLRFVFRNDFFVFIHRFQLENVNYVVLPRKSLILITQKSNPIHRLRQTTLISTTQQQPNRDSHSAKTTAPSTPTN